MDVRSRQGRESRVEPIEMQVMGLAEEVFRRLAAKARGGGMKRPTTEDGGAMTRSDDLHLTARAADTACTDAPGGN